MRDVHRASQGHWLNRSTIAGAVLLLLAGSSTLVADRARSALPTDADDRTIVHVLNRLGFGFSRGDLERVRRLGVEKYIDEQLHPERIPENEALEARLASFETLTLSTKVLTQEYDQPVKQLRRQAARAGQTAAPGDRDMGKMDEEGDPSSRSGVARTDTTDAPQAANAADEDPRGKVDASSPEAREELKAAVRRRALVGRELAQQKLLRATYGERQLQELLVDFWFNHFNVFGGGNTYAYVTEYERDVIRPHALGKFRDLLGATAHSPAMLRYLDNWRSVGPNAQGRLRPDRPRAPRAQQPPKEKAGLNENYARELMELHTLGVEGGYTQRDVIEVAKCFTGWTTRQPKQGGEAFFNPRMHEPGTKHVLGQEIDAGGEGDGEEVLDVLAQHPSTATFIATKLARRFVADDPPEALVERTAQRFRETDGDIRETVRTIVTSPEFFDAAAHRAKVKSPFEFVVSALRATEAHVDEGEALVRNLRQLGMPLYGAQPPTGYIDLARTWTSSGALLGRMNFALALANNRLDGVTVSLEPLLGSDPATAHQRLLASLLLNEASAETRATTAKGKSVAQVTALTLGSPEFQRK
ncbi:MAG: DUF1800 domain-containing protein [Vicinamibacteraceae bacterium]